MMSKVAMARQRGAQSRPAMRGGACGHQKACLSALVCIAAQTSKQNRHSKSKSRTVQQLAYGLNKMARVERASTQDKIGKSVAICTSTLLKPSRAQAGRRKRGESAS